MGLNIAAEPIINTSESINSLITKLISIFTSFINFAFYFSYY